MSLQALRESRLQGLFPYVLILITSTDGVTFQVWGHFHMCVTSSRSLPGAGRCLSPPGSEPVILVICGMPLRYVVFILPARIPAFLEEEVNKPPGLSPQESNFFTLGGPSVSLNTALL